MARAEAAVDRAAGDNTAYGTRGGPKQAVSNQAVANDRTSNASNHLASRRRRVAAIAVMVTRAAVIMVAVVADARVRGH